MKITLNIFSNLFYYKCSKYNQMFYNEQEAYYEISIAVSILNFQ